VNHEPKEPKCRFTGIFIPVEILEYPNISWSEKLLISWIDALYDEEKGGCYASNDYLASRLGVASNTIAKSLGNLRKAGLLEDVHFDGRERVIRALIGTFIDKKRSRASESKADLDKNPRGVGKKSNPGLAKNPSPTSSAHIDEIKEESKVRENTRAPDHQALESLGSEGLVKMTPKEYANLLQHMSEDERKERITDLELAIKKAGEKEFNKKYKSHYATLLSWKRLDQKKAQKTTLNAPGLTIEKNMKLAKDIERKLNGRAGNAKFECFEGYFEIVDSPDQPFILKYSENGFEEKLINRLRKMGIKI